MRAAELQSSVRIISFCRRCAEELRNEVLPLGRRALEKGAR